MITLKFGQRRLLAFLFAFCSTISLGFTTVYTSTFADKITQQFVAKNFLAAHFLNTVFAVFSELMNFRSLILFLVLFIFFNYMSDLKLENSGVLLLFSFLVTTFWSIAVSFQTSGSLRMLFYDKAFAVITLLTIIGNTLLIYEIVRFAANKFEKYVSGLSGNVSAAHFWQNFFVIAAIIFVLWLPYYFAIYPGALSWDTIVQIKEFFGRQVADTYPTAHYLYTASSSNLSDHHPVFLTLFYGLCIKYFPNHPDQGLFLASVLQSFLVICSFSFAISFLKSQPLPKFLPKIMLAGIGLVPFFPVNSMYLVKNVPYTAALLFFLILIVMRVTSDKLLVSKKCWLILLCLSVLLQMVSAKYGAMVILVTAIVLTISQLYLHKRPLLGLSLFIAALAFQLIWNSVVIPAFHIIPGDPIEAQSIQIQQTARFVKEHPEDVSRHEQKIINRVFVYRHLAHIYNPNVADPVKSHAAFMDPITTNSPNLGYRYKTVTSKALTAYHRVWLEMFFKHPMTYIDAFFNLNYQYLFISGQQKNFMTLGQPYYSSEFPLYLPAQNISFTQNRHYHKLLVSKKPVFFKKWIWNLMAVLTHTPIISLLLLGQFWALLLMAAIAYCIWQKRYLKIAVMLPVFLQFCICLLSAANGYSRYLLPMLFVAPFALTILFINQREKMF